VETEQGFTPGSWVLHVVASWLFCLLALYLTSLFGDKPFLAGAGGDPMTVCLIVGTMAGLAGMFVAQARRILQAGAFSTRTAAGMEAFSREGNPGCFWSLFSFLFLGAAFLFFAAVALLSGHEELLAWIP
jgi:hypothetical protein